MAANTVRKKAAGGKTAASKKSPASGGSRKSSSAATGAQGAKRTAKATKTNAGSKTRQSATDLKPEREQTNPMIVKEAFLWLILAVCILILISFFGIGGYVGAAVSDMCFGIFGITAYFFPILLFLASAFLISNRASAVAGIKVTSAVVLYVCVIGFSALLTGEYQELQTVAELFDYSAAHRLGGGAVGGAICRLLCPAIGAVGTGIVLVVAAIVCVVLVTQKSLMRGVKQSSSRMYRSAKESSARRREQHRIEDEERRAWEMEERERRSERVRARKRGKEPLRPQTGGEAAAPAQIDVPVFFPAHERESRAARRVTGVTMDTKLGGEQPFVETEAHEIIPDPAKARSMPFLENVESETYYVELGEDSLQDTAFEEDSAVKEPFGQPDADAFYTGQPGAGKSYTDVPYVQESGTDTSYGQEPGTDTSYGQEPCTDTSCGQESYADTPYGQDSCADTPYAQESHAEESASRGGRQKSSSGDPEAEVNPSETKQASHKNPRSSKQEIEEGIKSVEAEMAKAAEVIKPEYVYPPLNLLKRGKGKSGSGQQQEIRQTAMKLQQTLNSFGVHVTVTNVSCGPSVTRYELQPEQGVKVSRIVSLSDDIKLNLAAADIRIEAPIPGKAAVGIEVPNSENSAVALRDLIESEAFQKHPSKLAFATGKDIGGKVVVSDIAKMPHLLIAGATGSGKSVCINTLIMSILYKADPEEVKLIMIDPKVVELSVYNGIPHLFIPVVTDPKKAAGALNWGVAEMTDRYNKFAELGVRDLKGYNQKIEAIKDVEDENKPKKMPQIVIIVDELADLMMVAPGEVEDSICRLAQLARAAGIHLIIATQRPSVNVITGLIKANMPSRIAFSVSSGVDSRTIIDMNGAEKLLGKGDMLFYPQGYQKPARVQGAFVSDEEVADVVDFLKNKNTDIAYDEKMEEQIAKVQLATAASRSGEDVDALFADAGKFIIDKDKASIGMLQRVFKIGFNRAARIMDQLSEAGVVGPEEGTKPRKILMSAEQFDNYLEEN